MEVGSSPILPFLISEENLESYKIVGIIEWWFDRTELWFVFKVGTKKFIEVSIKKGTNVKDIIQKIRDKLVERLGLSSGNLEILDKYVLTDIETQVNNNLEKIHKTYFEEQSELNPLVIDAIKLLATNKGAKITDKDINFIWEIMTKEAPEDLLAVKQIVYAMKSTHTNLKIPTEINSRREGSGKSYLQDHCLEFEDQKYVRNYADISEKALYHQAGLDVLEDPITKKLEDIAPRMNELYARIQDLNEQIIIEKEKPPVSRSKNKDDNNDSNPTETRDKHKINDLEIKKRECYREIESLESRAEKLIDLNFILISVSDTPNSVIFHRLMSILSQDTHKDQIFMFTDNDNKGHKKARNIRLRGSPGFIYSQVIIDTKDPRFLEKNRRFVKVVPNTTEKKVEKATDQMWNGFSLTDDEYDDEVVSREDKERVKELMSLLDAKLIVHSTQFGHKKTGLRIPFRETMQIAAHDKKLTWQLTVQERRVSILQLLR
jgi:hypothetical protein